MLAAAANLLQLLTFGAEQGLHAQLSHGERNTLASALRMLRCGGVWHAVHDMAGKLRSTALPHSPSILYNNGRRWREGHTPRMRTHRCL